MRDLKEELTQYQKLSKEISLEANIKDQKKYKEIISEYNKLDAYIPIYVSYLEKVEEEKDLAQLIKEDPSLKNEANQEIEKLKKEQETLKEKIKSKLGETKENFLKLIMEIRAGTGGEEACLFAADLYRMYTRYCENKNWKIEVISTSLSQTGGLKETAFLISGKGSWQMLKNEVGTHRVQRIPTTESSGRIHTSAATVVALPFIEEDELIINESEIRIDTYRASGAGGQHVNTTDSAIRITHFETGVVVTCQDERSQLKNKEKAMKLLRARVYEHKKLKKEMEEKQQRKAQVGSGDRSERIRTYNFPQGRITDHRLNVTQHNLQDFLDGNIEKMTSKLSKEWSNQAKEELLF